MTSMPSPQKNMKAEVVARIHQATGQPFLETMSRLGAFAGVALALLWPTPARALLAEYQAAVTNEPSLISYYTFDQSNAADARGTNNGTLMGTTAFAAGVGGGNALSLSGAGRVNLGVVEDFAFTNDDTGSAEAWVKAGSFKDNACIFANRDGYSRWDVHMNSDKLGIGMWNGGTYYPTVAIPNPSTNWHHLVVVFADAYFTVYWDGALAGTVSRPLGYTDFTKSTQIGSPSPSANSEGWVGMLDEVAIYADALTPEAVQAHYQAYFAGNPPVITKQPRGGTYVPGAALTLNVQATGPSLSYQWYKGATLLSGKTTNTLTFPGLAAGDAGTYSVRVSNTTAVVTSSNATIALAALPTPLVHYQTAVSNEASLISYYTFDRLLPEDVIGPNEGTLAGTATWAAGIGGGSAQGLLLDGAGHVNLGSVPSIDFASGVGTVEGWFRADWTSVGYWPCMWADRNGGPTVWSLHLSDTKGTPAFYNGSGSSWFVLPGGAGTNWHHVATVFTNGTASFYVDGNLIQYSPMSRALGAGPGTVQLGSSASSSTSEGWIGMLDEIAFYASALPAASIQAHYNAYMAGDPPVITSQPIGGDYLVGQLGQLSVAASGALLTYQWYKDGSPISGMTNAIIGPVNLTAAFSGAYYVQVTNPAGSTNSAIAIVQVGNNMARYQATVLAESSLISYYTFDASDAQDAKNAHSGTVANVVTYETGPGGVTNLSLTLDGTGHIDLGPVADFDFGSGSGTIEGWVRPNWSNPAAYNPCLFADRDGDGSVWSVHMSAWKTEIGNFSSGYQSLTIGSDNGWHHYAIVFDAGTVSMYWDGRFRGSFNQPINSFLAKTTQIGSSAPTTTTEGWMGGLDEVAFYGTALGADTIGNHFLAMVGPPSLSYSIAGTQLTLSWPAEVTGYTLESAPTLTTTSWTPVPGVVNNQVTVDASVGVQFFRLGR
jgi:hypothetical protein